jgi:phosphoserine/homoserine phosphotransferase
MKRRLDILAEHGLKLADIQAVIAAMDPLPGALEFLTWLRDAAQAVIVSDTFVQFAGPLMKKLGRPTLLCNSLEVSADGTVTGYRLRQPDGKRKVVQAMQSLNYRVTAVGDSYNDITMLQAADNGILFRPPENIRKEYSQLPVTTDYADLKNRLQAILESKR